MSSTDDEIVVALTANATQLEAGMAQATASIQDMQATVAQEAAAFNAAVNAKLDAMTRLNAAMSGSLGSTEGMAEAEAALDQAMNTGAITTREYTGYVATLDAAEAALTATTTAATAAVEANTGVVLNSRAAYSASALITDALTGQFSRSRREIGALANETGLLSGAFSFLLSPAGLLLEAMAAVGLAAVEGSKDFGSFQNIVELTNNTLGMTAGDLVQLRDNIANSTGSYGNATKAVQALGSSGQFTADQLGVAAQAAVQFADATGMKLDEVDKLLIQMATDPKKAVDELQNSLHILSAAEADQVQQLLRVGDSAGASAVEIQAFAQRAQQAENDVGSKTSWLVTRFDDVTHSIANAAHGFEEFMNVSTGGGDAAEQLDVINRRIATIKNSLLTLTPVGQIELHSLEQQQTQLEQQVATQHQNAQAAAATAAQLKAMTVQLGTFSALQKEGMQGVDLTGNLEKQLTELADAENVSYQNREALDRQYWGYVFQNTQAGTAAHEQAFQQIQQLQQQSDQQMEQSLHQQEAAAKQAAEARVQAEKEADQKILQALGEQRAETEVASAARIAVDAQAMTKIAAMYGQNSTQFREALNQRLSDTKAFVDASVAAQKAAEAQVAGIYKSENELAIKSVSDLYATREKAAQDQLQLGQLTSTQEAALMRQLADQEYQIEMNILEHYRELMAERPAVVATINAQIEALQNQHNQRMQEIDQKAAMQQQQLWESRLKPITQAFDQSIEGMIQGTQTLKQGWDKMLESLLMSEVRNCVDRLGKWTATEIAQTAATNAGNAARTASDAAAARTGMALSGEMSEKQIYNSAYTAAANAYASVSAIPVVGWLLGPIAAAATFAGVEAFDNVSSAAGGWDRVPYDDAPALLHRNEMVLPAHLAENVRNMTGNGSGGGGDGAIHNHFSMLDGRSAHQLLMSDRSGLKKMSQRAAQLHKARR